MSTTSYIVDLNMSGWGWMLLHIQEWAADAVYYILLGAHKEELGPTRGSQRQQHKGEVTFINTSAPWS